MQTPPKDRSPEFRYGIEMLSKGLEVACKLEQAITKWAGNNQQKRMDKMKSVYFALMIKYT